MTDALRPAPLLSVVLATDTFDTIRPVLAALRRQRCPERIEPVVVLPATEVTTVRREELGAFAEPQIVSIDAVRPLSAARAAGVHAATAPIVFIGETHTYPQPGWVDALLAAFEDPWSVVVPAIGNANPTGPVSWASYVFDYGAWDRKRPPGEMSDPLIYNTAYRRMTLLTLGTELPKALDPAEEAMWPELKAAGHRAVFAPDAYILHLNVNRLNWLLLEKLCAGGVVGIRRASRWGWRRRILYIVASPLIPIVLVGRLLPALGRLGLRRLPFGTLPILVLIAIAKALGELVGYAGLRPPWMHEVLADTEIRKVDYAGRHG